MNTPVISPFRPGVGTIPAFIADRETQMQTFRRALREVPERPHNFRVTGLRGVGKTVLIKEYEAAARAAKWVVVREEWNPRYRDEAAFAQRVVTDLESVIGKLSLAHRLGQAAKDALTHIKGEMAWELEGGVTIRMAGKSAPSQPFEDRLASSLKRVGELASKHERAVLLLYDEAHTVRDNKSKGQLPLNALLGAFVQAQDDKLPVVLGLCGLPYLAPNLRKARTHAERFFNVEELDNLPTARESDGKPSLAALALIEAARGSAVEFDPATAERIAADVDGYPYFIQRYGDDLWNAAYDAGLTVVDDVVYDSQREHIQDSLDVQFYEGRFDDAKRADQQTLRLAGSIGGEGFTMAGIQKLHAKANYGATQQSLNRLIQDGLIYNVRYGEYAYTAPRFGDFLRRKHPPGELDT